MKKLLEKLHDKEHTSDWWSPSIEEKLLSNQLIDSIQKGGDRINVSLTGKGLCCVLNALVTNQREAEATKEVEVNPKDELLTKEEVMQRLGVSNTTLWSWARSGYLPIVKIGRKVRYRLSDVMSLLK